MTKLMDYALCDEPTEKRPVMRPTCDGRPYEVECGAPGAQLYTTSEGRVVWLCALHYYQLKCIEQWDEIRRQMTRRQEAS
jgi:hypothetical protein